MKLISKQDATKRIQNAGRVAEAEVKTVSDVAKLATDLKQQIPCILLICVK